MKNKKRNYNKRPKAQHTNALQVHWNCFGKGKHGVHIMHRHSLNVIATLHVSKKDADALIDAGVSHES